MALEHAEFERLALEQMDMLYRIARRLTRDPAQAEDLVQETFLRALKGREGFSHQGYGIRPWLLRIMHNLFISRAERERRQPLAIAEDQLDGGATASSAGGPPLTFGSFDGMDERLVRALNQLPPEYQTVLLLWAVDDLSYKEIAEAVDIPIGTVMSRLHRARQRLTEQLQDFAREERIIRE